MYLEDWKIQYLYEAGIPKRLVSRLTDVELSKFFSDIQSFELFKSIMRCSDMMDGLNPTREELDRLKESGMIAKDSDYLDRLTMFTRIFNNWQKIMEERE